MECSHADAGHAGCPQGRAPTIGDTHFVYCIPQGEHKVRPYRLSLLTPHSEKGEHKVRPYEKLFYASW